MASDLGRHCLPVSLLLDARHKWVKSTWLYTERADEERTDNHDFDPVKPHFYIVKLEFSVVYIILLISAQKHTLWVLVRIASARRF